MRSTMAYTALQGILLNGGCAFGRFPFELFVLSIKYNWTLFFMTVTNSSCHQELAALLQKNNMPYSTSKVVARYSWIRICTAKSVIKCINIGSLLPIKEFPHSFKGKKVPFVYRWQGRCFLQGPICRPDGGSLYWR